MPTVKDPIFRNLHQQIIAVGPSSLLLRLAFKEVLILRPDLIPCSMISERYPVFTMIIQTYPGLSKMIGAYPELANWKSSLAIRQKYNRFWNRFKKRVKDEMRGDNCVVTYGGSLNYERPFLDSDGLNQRVEPLFVEPLEAADDESTSSDDYESVIDELQTYYDYEIVIAELQQKYYDNNLEPDLNPGEEPLSSTAPLESNVSEPDLNPGEEAVSTAPLESNVDECNGHDYESEIDEMQKNYEVRQIIWDHFMDSYDIDRDETPIERMC